MSGFHFGKRGLYLKPGATGELVYDFRVREDLRFKEVSLPGGRNGIKVSLDEGWTWTTTYENFQNAGDVVKYDLTSHVGGSSRFLLKFWIQNTDQEIIALDCLVLEAHVE